MKRINILTFLLLLSYVLGAQGTAELDSKGGFQDILLMEKVEDLEGLEFKKNFKDKRYPGAKIYSNVKGKYNEIGSLKVYSVQVKAYKGMIYEIIVEAEKSIGLYRGLVSSYGEPKYSHREKKNYWRADKIKLWYSIKGNNKIILEYYSLEMEKVRKKEQEDNLQEVIDDF